MKQAIQMPRRVGKSAAAELANRQMTDPIQGEYLAASVSTKYQQRTTSAAKRIADLVRERGIEGGTLSVRIARQVDPHVNVGDTLQIAGATFIVAIK